MASKQHRQNAGGDGTETDPAWANGLKQLYDEVVEEPLPDAFMDLLAELDSPDQSSVESKKSPLNRGRS